MTSFAKPALAGALVVALFLAGCSSDSGSDSAAKDATTTTAARRTTTTVDPTMTPLEEVLDQLEKIDTSDFCDGLASWTNVSAAVLQAQEGTFSEADRATIGEANVAFFERLGESAPEAIADAWKVAAPGLAEASGQTKEQNEAYTEVGQWVTANCTPPSR